VEFRILGPLEVSHGGRPVRIRGAKERALLAILLMHANEVVSVDRLIDELWNDRPPATARKSVQVRIAGLRRALRDGILSTRGGGYAISLAGDQLDLHRFERLLSEGRELLAGGDARAAAGALGEAISLWRGPALADFAYESFAQLEVARLEELRLAALELRIDAQLALGLPAPVVAELEDLIVAHPLRERLRGQLMLALYRDGRQAEALDVYERTRDQLVAELGIEPGPALRRLQQSILRQDPSLDLPLALPERSILVSPQDPRTLEVLLALAEPLAKAPAHELIIARLIGEGADVSETARLLNEQRQALLTRGVAARAITFTSEAAGDDLVRIALRQDVDLLLVDGDSGLRRSPVLSTVLTSAPCDVAVYVGRDDPPDEGPILVLFGGSDHDWTAVEVGAWIARARDRPLRLAGPARGAERDASRTLASASLAVQRVLGIAVEPVLVAPAAADVLAAAAESALVVVGLPERWNREGLGPVRGALAVAGTCTLFVRRGLRPGGLAPREGLTRFTWTLGSAD
jgi:DNA-binding SARP family transcriptional activator